MPPPPQPRWNPATRLAFRFGFSYFILYALCNGNATPWEAVPFGYGLLLAGIAAWPFNHAALWCGHHIFHLQGVGATLHGSGFGDRALDYVAWALMLVVAVIATIVWSALDRRRPNYTTLFTWMRFTLRLSLAAGMFVYAAMKISPWQIAAPSLAILNEPVGRVSPLSLLWVTLGLSPLYESLCGILEWVAGTLLIFRRTALAGTLVSIVILSNIVLFDFFFDVPVKLYSANLLAMALVVTLPDLRPVLTFFFTRDPASKSSLWSPSTRTHRARNLLIAAEVLFFLSLGVELPIRKHALYAFEAANLRNPSPLTGQWHVEAASAPYLTGDGLPVSDIFLEPNGLITLRATDETLWGGGRTDYPNHRLQMISALRFTRDYTLTQPDPTHLLLTPADPHDPTLHLTRVPLLNDYRLLHRGFHWINEWGFEQ